MAEKGCSSSSRRQYKKITDKQRDVLSSYYEKGMTGTGQAYLAAIEGAASETGLTVEQVKKWVGNERGKRKESPDNSGGGEPPQKIRVPGCRGQTAYNLFCGEFFQSEQSSSNLLERNKAAAAKWRSLSEDEKKKYKDAATGLKEADFSTLDTVQRKKLVSTHQKNIIKEISFLEALGCETAVLFKNAAGDVFNFGSHSGVSFLITNPEVNIKFRQYFSCSKTTYTYKDVQKLFNAKYSEAVQRPGSRVPYLRGDFEVHNLPEGVVFKRPYCYGPKQLRAIMECQEEIKIVLKPKTSTVGQGCKNASANQEIPSTEDDRILRLLTAVAGEASATRALQNVKLISEEEVEVLDLHLPQEDRLLLYSSCRRYFDDDAWLAVGANIRHSNDEPQVVLPVYTDSDEPFWLFLATQRLSTVLKSTLNSKIKGYWLDIKSEEQSLYELIHTHSDIILGKNIVKTEHGPLYYCCETHMQIKDGQSFLLPPLFKAAVMTYTTPCSM